MANTTVTQNDTALNRLARIVSTDWIVPPVSVRPEPHLVDGVAAADDDLIEIDDRWRQAFVERRVADVLAQLCADQRFTALDAADRAWLRDQVDQLVADAMERFNAVPAPGPSDVPSRMQQFIQDVNEGRR